MHYFSPFYAHSVAAARQKFQILKWLNFNMKYIQYIKNYNICSLYIYIPTFWINEPFLKKLILFRKFARCFLVSVHFCTSFFNLTPTGHKLLPVKLFKEPEDWVCFPSCPNKNFCSALTPRTYPSTTYNPKKNDKSYHKGKPVLKEIYWALDLLDFIDF